MLKRKFEILTSISFALLVTSVTSVMAAPLPDGTLLEIEMGANPDNTGQCTVGSCLGVEVSPTDWLWFNIGPGNDGGIIVGKNQLSGGQEIIPDSSNSTPGDMTGAFGFLDGSATFFADHALNIFSDTANSGETLINQFSWAWNGQTIEIGGGNVNNYSISQDSLGNFYYSLDYQVIITEGPFAGVNVRLILRSAFTIPPDGNTAPVVNNVNITGESGARLNWTPSFTGDAGDVHSCAIVSNGINGNATVNTDCSAGTYTSGSGFVGQDSFSYSVTDQFNLASQAVVTADVTPEIVNLCLNTVPIRRLSSFGGGQSTAINGTLVTTFTGHITTENGLTSGGKNTVKICPGSSVAFTASSGIGSANCLVNGIGVGESGHLNVGDKLICTNKPDGGDVDRFSIKSGL